jgi:hypothetical protein
VFEAGFITRSIGRLAARESTIASHPIAFIAHQSLLEGRQRARSIRKSMESSARELPPSWLPRDQQRVHSCTRSRALLPFQHMVARLGIDSNQALTAFDGSLKAATGRNSLPSSSSALLRAASVGFYIHEPHYQTIFIPANEAFA